MDDMENRELIQNTINYLKREYYKGVKSLENAEKKPNTSKQEIDNIINKVNYLDFAVTVIENVLEGL